MHEEDKKRAPQMLRTTAAVDALIDATIARRRERDGVPPTKSAIMREALVRGLNGLMSDMDKLDAGHTTQAPAKPIKSAVQELTYVRGEE